MKPIHKLTVVTLMVMLSDCSLMPPRRQYISDLKQQSIPQELLDCEWRLVSFDNKPPDCTLTLKFLARGQFTFTFKNEIYAGDNLWYVVKGSVIEFHTRPLEKFAWTSDDCEMNPSIFALYLMGDKNVVLYDDKLTFAAFHNKHFVFQKV